MSMTVYGRNTTGQTNPDIMPRLPRDKMPQTKTTPDKMTDGKKTPDKMPPKKWTAGQNATGEGIADLQACSSSNSSRLFIRRSKTKVTKHRSSAEYI